MSDDKHSISVIEPGHDKYEDYDVHPDESSRKQATKFYNEVIAAYNDSPVEAVLIVPLPPYMKFYNLRNIFAGRGLKYGTDVIMSRQEVDEEGLPLPRNSRPAKIKKLTKAQGKIVDKYESSEDDL